jgi:hypothetical protein
MSQAPPLDKILGIVASFHVKFLHTYIHSHTVTELLQFCKLTLRYLFSKLILKVSERKKIPSGEWKNNNANNFCFASFTWFTTNVTEQTSLF